MSSPQENQKRGSVGCLGYGCAVAVLILTLILGLVFFYVLTSFRGAIDKYTAPERPGFELSEPDSSVLSSSAQKLAHLAALLRDPSGRGGESMTGAEVTAALRSSLGNQIDVRLSNGGFYLRFALPISEIYRDDFFWPKLLLGSRGGRFAVGEAEGRLALKRVGSELHATSVEVTLTSLRLNGHRLEGDALVRASEWFSGWASSEVGTATTADGADRPSLAGRLAGLEVSGESLSVRIEPAK